MFTVVGFQKVKLIEECWCRYIQCGLWSVWNQCL